MFHKIKYGKDKHKTGHPEYHYIYKKIKVAWRICLLEQHIKNNMNLILTP